MSEHRICEQVYKFGDFVLHADGPMLMREGVRVPVTPRALNVLLVLVENAGRIIAKETLLNQVWADSFVEEGNLNRTVSRLRKTLGDSGTEFIETIPRIGYRFVADVELGTTPAAFAGNTPQPPAIENSNRPRKYGAGVVLTATAGLVIVGLLAIWFLRPAPRTARSEDSPPSKHTPKRLTHNPTREERPVFTGDGRIRFTRFQGDTPLTFVMNEDGSDARRDSSIAGLRTGSWSPDGKRVVYFKEGYDSKSPYLADASGSNETLLPFEAGNMEWSPDGSRIVYQYAGRNSEIALYTIATGKITDVVIHPAFESDPSFSPDGNSIVFVSDRDGNPEIYYQNIDGSNFRRLTDHPAHDEFPTFSPDGTQIVFNSNREDENFDVYVMNVDGTGVRRLTNWVSDEEVRPGCWSADGTQIVLASNREGKSNIYIMDVEPFAPRLVVGDKARDFTFPGYSPDGKALVYVSEGEDKSGTVYLRDLTTGRERSLIRSDSADMYPRFSPDGRSLLFQQRVVGNAEVCVISVEGGEARNLTNSPTRDAEAAWSPDGSRIVFVSNRDGNYDVFNLYVMNADGSNQHRIYYSNAVSNHPSWSPDGRQIIFANDKEDDRSGNFEIFSIEPETVNPEKRLTMHRRYDIHPTFSPDGNRIAFTSNADGNMEIYVMNADGSGMIRVTRDRGEDTSPAWSPDGRRIIFSSNRSGRYAIYEVAVESPGRAPS